MPEPLNSIMGKVQPGRLRNLWLVMGDILLVSALPLVLYHRQVLKLSQEKLVDTERVQQTELTRSIAKELQPYESHVTQQLMSDRQILVLTGAIQDVEDPATEPKVTRLLENSVESNPSTFLYLTAVGKSGKGTSASQGNCRAEKDPFVSKALQRAFITCVQSPQLGSVKFRSDPLALEPDNQPAFVIAIPLNVDQQFTGMIAAVVSLNPILHRLKDASVRGRSVFVDDHQGHIVAHHDTGNFTPAEDRSANSPVGASVRSLPREVR